MKTKSKTPKIRKNIFVAYHFAQKCIVFVQYEIYSSKSGCFLIFMCYLCHVGRSFIDL